eukprot:SAG11_NODE_279_length_11283_cov_11.461820_7_plen_100_part_00
MGCGASSGAQKVAAPTSAVGGRSDGPVATDIAAADVAIGPAWRQIRYSELELDEDARIGEGGQGMVFAARLGTGIQIVFFLNFPPLSMDDSNTARVWLS